MDSHILSILFAISLLFVNLLGYEFKVCCGKLVTTFWRNVLPPFLGFKQE
jgi:hypothetical protein